MGEGWAELERQQRLMMLALDDLLPGVICVDTQCPTGLPTPHMANDNGPHPCPYGVKPPWSASAFAKHRRDRAREARESGDR